jgi:hypothetical protein
MPDIYTRFSTEIGVVLTVMDCLRAYLDVPPGVGLDNQAKALLEEIARLDVSALLAARERLRTRVDELRARGTR